MINIIKCTIIFACLITVANSCHNEDDIVIPELRIRKVFVRDVGEFDFQDSLTFAAADTTEYFVKFITEPSDAEIYHSPASKHFKKLNTEWILINSEISKLNFYLKFDRFKTEIKTLDFSFNESSTIENATLYPNPCADDRINIAFESKTRGHLQYQITTADGHPLKSGKEFIDSNSFLKEIDIQDLETGQYNIKLKYGNTTKSIRFYRL